MIYYFVSGQFLRQIACLIEGLFSLTTKFNLIIAIAFKEILSIILISVEISSALEFNGY